MLDNVKCECGHANPVGTTLCESCGAPLADGTAANQKLDMRYEGAARRSQVYQKTIVDRVWNFFSSVRNAVIMIVLTLIASAIGTIFPQERYIPVPKPAEQYYPEAYGTLGFIYYKLGLHNLYSSWWFIALMLGIGISLVICSLDRVVPLYRALKKQRVKRDKKFLQIQKVSTELDASDKDVEQLAVSLEEALKKKRYHVRREQNALLGEKGRFSRWGPYINHIGLIIFLVGCLMRLIPGFYLDQYVWVREGQTVPVPETNYYVKNVQFVKEYYQDDEFPEKLDLDGVVVKEYKTKAILYENENADIPGSEPKLKQVTQHDIQVNHPLKYEGLLLYQSGEQENQLQALNLNLMDTATKQPLGSVKLDLLSPPKEVKASNDVTVQVLQYFPDFALDENKQPITKSTEPNNPAFIVNTVSPKTPNGEKQWIFLGNTLTADGKEPTITYTFTKPDLVDMTGLMVRKDNSIPVIFFGAAISMIGLVMGFYWQHRRIWFQIEGDRLLVAAHTNKNWFGVKNEVVKILEANGYHISAAQLEKEAKQS
ncbi:cytochrome c biogenesis protein ResB [Aneurinibacillus migulanus]|uniref:cytochrome c biogenesis protein ResB n=1 Tax=Aneurinibacillus migulanus TaxID=47500 RepID=UPI0006A1268F|nr:cytochrome c biogenesis protein ResB [Aneurinibacillus migulanus]MCP1354245.1 cytochrome c biogenesis protein ResB [Aneurinibacillus migulanus]CEH29945.1 Putative cytochrome C biogenesis protein ResB [Aneurinibacillus migulanus]